MVTARRLVEIAGLQAVIAGLKDVEIVYLDDVRRNLSLADKLMAVLGRMAPRLDGGADQAPAKTAVILFTSGTEGRAQGRRIEP